MKGVCMAGTRGGTGNVGEAKDIVEISGSVLPYGGWMSVGRTCMENFSRAEGVNTKTSWAVAVRSRLLGARGASGVDSMPLTTH